MLCEADNPRKHKYDAGQCHAVTPHLLYSAESEWGFISHFLICFDVFGSASGFVAFRHSSNTLYQKYLSSSVGFSVSRLAHHQSGKPWSLSHSVGVSLLTI